MMVPARDSMARSRFMDLRSGSRRDGIDSGDVKEMEKLFLSLA